MGLVGDRTRGSGREWRVRLRQLVELGAQLSAGFGCETRSDVADVDKFAGRVVGPQQQ